MAEMQVNGEAKTKPNILSQYFRQPKIFVKLPSQGMFYPPGALDVSATGEYPVYAMTAKDELLLKTPDALMNGQATVEVIKSCIPAIKDPWQMPTIDVDAMLMAIRIATHGKDMEVGAYCPSCNNENEYVFDLVNYLGTLSTFTFETDITVGPLTIKIRPYSYQEGTKASMKTLEQQRIFNIVNDDTIPDEEKIEKFGVSFVKLTELTVEIVCGCIASIITPEGEVTDQQQISEFISNTTAEVFNQVNDHITRMKNAIELKTQQVSCNECQHEYMISLTMDQSNFFAVRS